MEVDKETLLCSESIREHGNEIFRVSATVIGMENIKQAILTDNAANKKSQKIHDSYKRLLSETIKAASKEIGEKARKEYTTLREVGEGYKFRRYVCSVKFRLCASKESFLCVICDTCINRGGRGIFYRRRSQIWDLSKGIMLQGNKLRRFLKGLLTDDKSTSLPKKYDGAFFTNDSVIFFKNATDGASYSEKSFTRQELPQSNPKSDIKS